MTAPGVLAVIIGRAGSKGLPGKNIELIDNRSMVSYTIADARRTQDTKQISRIIVSTDSPELAEAALREEVEVVNRPAELATDTATVDAAVRHAVQETGSTEDIVVILYANVPIRPNDLISRAIEKLVETGADSVQSYSQVGKYHPYWMVTLDEDERVAAHHPNSIYRRQDLPKLLIPDGGVIAVTRESLFNVVEGEPHAFLGIDRRGIENEPGAVVDIDSKFDLTIAQVMLLHDKDEQDEAPS